MEAFAEEIRQCVYGKIKKSVEVFDAFVFLGDESEDNSHIERASHVVRYLEPETGEIQEAFVGLQPLKTTDSAAILEQAPLVFKKMGVPDSKLSAVGFDGGSAYAGCHTGVRARLREFSPNVVYIWCNNHIDWSSADMAGGDSKNVGVLPLRTDFCTCCVYWSRIVIL